VYPWRVGGGWERELVANCKHMESVRTVKLLGLRIILGLVLLSAKTDIKKLDCSYRFHAACLIAWFHTTRARLAARRLPLCTLGGDSSSTQQAFLSVVGREATLTHSHTHTHTHTLTHTLTHTQTHTHTHTHTRARAHTHCPCASLCSGSFAERDLQLKALMHLFFQTHLNKWTSAR